MLDVKPFRQSPGYCGPACVKIIFGYFGLDVSESTVAKLSGTTRSFGVEADGLVRAVRQLGWKGYWKDNATMKDLVALVEKKKIPVIVNWFTNDEGHFSVVVGIDDGNVYLQDPELGALRAIRKKTFFRIWFAFSTDWARTKNDLILRRIIVCTPT